jgi:hypothetical protein
MLIKLGIYLQLGYLAASDLEDDIKNRILTLP